LDIFSGCRKAEFIDTAEVSKVFHYLKSIIDDVPSVRLIVTDNNKLIVEAKDTEGLIVPLIIPRPIDTMPTAGTISHTGSPQPGFTSTIDTGTKPYPFNE
jgi:hypothetical protein